ncbi:MAG: LysR family transcriptional regulator [Mogibacterium sp.]|nr:LysR family transcriptional regulator [Mogibacterium sp.]
MNIRDLDCFIKVYECRSISVASEKLFISAQGLSNVISRLEQELGCYLFNRDRAGSVPTACGETFYRYAVSAKSEYDRMITDIEHVARAERGIIKIGYSFGVMAGLTMGITQEFQKKYPEYELDFAEMPDKVVEDLVLSGEIDIGFASYVDKDKFEYEIINESEILFVPMRSSRFYERETVSVPEIAEEPLTLRNRNFATTRIMMHEFEKCGADPEVILNTGGILRSLKLRKDGMANTVIIESVAEQLESDELRTVPFAEELKWPLYLITKKGKSRSKAVDTFISFITGNRNDR